MKKFLKFFTPPTLSSTRESQAAKYVFLMGWVFTAIIFFLEGFFLFSTPGPLFYFRLFVMISAVGFQLLNVRLLRSGKRKAVYFIFIIYYFLLFITFIFLSGEQNTPIFIGFPVVYLLTILFFDWKYSAYVGVFVFTSLAAILFIEVKRPDLFISKISYSSLEQAIIAFLVVVILLFILSFGSKNYKMLLSNYEKTNDLMTKAQYLANFGIWEWDIERNISTLSEGLLRIFEAPENNDINTYEGFLGRVSSEYKDIMDAYITQVINTGKTFLLEYEINTFNDQRKMVKSWGEVYNRQDNKPSQMIGVTQDITEQYRVCEDLKVANKNLIFLNDIMGAILKTRSMEEIIEVVLEHSYPNTECDIAGVLKVEQENKICKIIDLMLFNENLEISPIKDEGIPTDVEAMLKLYSQFPYHLVNDLPTREKNYQGEDFLVPLGIRSYLGVPLYEGESLAGVLFFGSQKVNHFSTEQGEYLINVASSLSLAMQQASLYDKIRTGRYEMQLLSQELVNLQEKERRFLAIELHDEIGQSLTGIRYQIETMIHFPKKINPEDLKQTYQLTDDLINQVREMSLALRPTMLDDLGLLPTLLWYIKTFQENTGIEINFKHNGLENRFLVDLETAIYRIIQEGLTNIARHAKVDKASIEVKVQEENIIVHIKDKGIGFDYQQGHTDYKNIGLISIRERVLSQGGYLSIESAKGEGTKLKAIFPIEGRLERRKVQRDE